MTLAESITTSRRFAKSALRSGRAAMPRSPATQSPGGILKSACTKPAVSSRSATTSAGYSQGNRYSTALNQHSAAAAKRSRKSISVNIIDRLAANWGISVFLLQAVNSRPAFFAS
ncbi:hypothetical protein BSY240_4601 (plasmid) [Agrobacterium sp. RAC06]|nr:hypothetical protein BSY240_4601 [Agrobacterium sp. RAC06]